MGKFSTLGATAGSGAILALVPIIAVFFGIVVRMFYRDHEPAHFHAEHQGQQAKFDFSGKMLAGNSVQDRVSADSAMGSASPD